MPRYGRGNLSIYGVKQMKEKLNGVANDLQGADIYAALGRAVQPMASAVKAGAANYSHTVAASVYTAANPPPSQPTKKTALLVVHKKDTMREWTARLGNKSPNAKIAAGGKVAESLANMINAGTSRGMLAKNFFRDAVTATRGQVRSNLITEVDALVTNAIAKRNGPLSED